jgi:hypothetical protein
MLYFLFTLWLLENVMNAILNELSNNDFSLGFGNFSYSDLFRPEKLRELAETFYADLTAQNAELGNALTQYISARGENYERKAPILLLIFRILSQNFFTLKRNTKHFSQKFTPTIQFGSINFLFKEKSQKNITKNH